MNSDLTGINNQAISLLSKQLCSKSKFVRDYRHRNQPSLVVQAFQTKVHMDGFDPFLY